MKEIYTIGYAAFSIKDFLNIVLKNNISCVIDVRSYPYSKFYTQYNSDILSELLKKNNIYYRNYKEEFGARQNDKAFYAEQGYLDFNKYVKSKQFLSGMEKIKNGIEKKYSFILMCAEKDPINCHRNIMIGRAFYEEGYEVKNILQTNQIELQQDLQKRLVQLYFNKNNQSDLFIPNKSDVEIIQTAYDKKNAEIGFRNSEIEEE